MASQYWEGLDVELELGFNTVAPFYSDEPTAIEHRLAEATGGRYGSPPFHWCWQGFHHACDSHRACS